MTGRLKIHLKANERIYINGAVLKVDRKVAIELMNDVVFLLEGHVLQQEQATSPLRQLYFVVQAMLIEPRTEALARQIYEQQHKSLIATFKNQDILEGLMELKELVNRGKVFEGLRRLRSMFELEDRLLGAPPAPAVQDKVVA